MMAGHAFRSFFPGPARALGERWARDGRVEVYGVDEAGVFVAEVHEDYVEEVRLVHDQEADELRVACSCLQYQIQPRGCAHIWALLLELWWEDHDLLITEWTRVFSLPELLENENEPNERPPWRDLVENNVCSPVKTHDWRLLYLIDTAGLAAENQLSVTLRLQRVLKGNRWGTVKTAGLRQLEVADLGPEDRAVFAALRGASYSGYSTDIWRAPYMSLPEDWRLSSILARKTLQQVCKTGRLGIVAPDGGPPTVPLIWDDGPPWRLQLEFEKAENENSGEISVVGRLVRHAESMELEELRLLAHCGVLVVGDRVAALDTQGAWKWLVELYSHGRLPIPEGDVREFVDALHLAPARPLLRMPADLAWEEQEIPLVTRLAVRAPLVSRRKRGSVPAEIYFDYGSHCVPAGRPGHSIPIDDERRFIPRQLEAEGRAIARLRELGYRQMAAGDEGVGIGLIDSAELPAAVAALFEEGWTIEAEGRRMRSGSTRSVSVESGVDWFEIRAEVDFSGESVGLPRLLEAHRSGEKMIRLGDGSYGMLPEAWLRQWAAFSELGTVKDGGLRLAVTQVFLLDAWIAEQEVSTDETFEAARAALAGFDGIKARRESKSFHGSLRTYQREGLGWFAFLEEFGLGGCLADDMGLGKTIEVLALLVGRRRKGPRKERRPSLVVVPRTLLHNWNDEAARFTPSLKRLTHWGTGRAKDAEAFHGIDLVLTTYGTLRRDIAWLRMVAFDYAILDEAQAIKNRHSQAAKAVRLITARHRLALSGTPIENHIGELWSLIEFLNPGMLGAAASFERWARSAQGSAPEVLDAIARSVRPIILRRTKGQVMKELPPKEEQTLLCEMSPGQRELYDELREHYRVELSAGADDDDLGRSKLMVLEALLRLRQAACHVALVDPARASVPSGKFDLLLERLDEVIAEGHKALIFSQFTSLLALLRPELDKRGIRYSYLDGKTRKREDKVRAFREDDAVKAFLISIKAGGLGLNLIEADYVFLLDPWWNPAVEAQAIDRSHRIGQTKPVFAYRLISQDSIEEKVLELQREKRALADAIIRDDGSLVRDLTRAELEILLS